MCSYIVEKAKLLGSAKGPNGWMRIDTANVYYDHPFHAPLDHALGIDFISEADGGRDRVAVELSAPPRASWWRRFLPRWLTAKSSTARRRTTRRRRPNSKLGASRPSRKRRHERRDPHALRRHSPEQAHRGGNPRPRSARKAQRGDHPRHLSGMARSPRDRVPRPAPIAGRFDPRDRLFRRTRRAVAAGEILSQGLFPSAPRHHADLQHPRERRADRRVARRRDDVPPRHDPRRGTEQGNLALLRGNSFDR